jgi:hypothetical protein
MLTKMPLSTFHLITQKCTFGNKVQEKGIQEKESLVLLINKH